MDPMLAERTPTLSFVVPRFNVLIQSLEQIVAHAAEMFIKLPQSNFQKTLRKWKAKAAQAGLDKIKQYYRISLKVPAFAIATIKFTFDSFALMNSNDFSLQF